MRERENNSTYQYLPTELNRAFLSSCVFGIGFIILAAYLSVSTGALMYLTLLLPGAYLIVNGLLLRRNWFVGAIEEVAVRCLSCRSQNIRGKMISVNSTLYKVVCTRDDEAETALYEVYLGRGAEQIEQNDHLILYLKKSDPRNPVAWRLI